MRLPVTVLPRLAAEARTPDAGEVCISIGNPRQSDPRLNGYAKVLRLCFHDTDRVGGGFQVMTYNQAKIALDFGWDHRAAPLTVHCEAGASRSVAVGLFLAAWLERPLKVEATDVLIPNPWVLNQLRAAALMRGLAKRDLALIKCGLFGTPQYLIGRSA